MSTSRYIHALLRPKVRSIVAVAALTVAGAQAADTMDERPLPFLPQSNSCRSAARTERPIEEEVPPGANTVQLDHVDDELGHGAARG